MVKIGLYFDLRDPGPDAMGPARRPAHSLELAEEADRRGIDSLWLSEHHFFEDGYLSQPLVFAAALAARTKRARIGTAVLLAPLRSPVTIVEEAAMVDAISGGRLELGIGAGYRVPEYAAFHANIKRRFKLLEERAAEIRRLWEDESITPRPVQSRAPLWIGAHGPRGAQIASSVGAGLLSLKPDLWEPFTASWGEAGNQAAPRSSGALSLILCDDPEKAWEQIRPYAERHWEMYDRYAREGAEEGGGPVPPTVFEQVDGGRRPPVEAVTVEQAIAQITALADGKNVEHVFLWERVSGMPEDVAQRHVELVVDQLRPALAAVGTPLDMRQSVSDLTSRGDS